MLTEEGKRFYEMINTLKGKDSGFDIIPDRLISIHAIK